MAIVCPACRASNDAGPTCRRCRAELQLLFDLEASRLALLNDARRAIHQGDWQSSEAALRQAEHLRQGSDIRQLRAIVYLLRGQFRAAWREYRQVTE